MIYVLKNNEPVNIDKFEKWIRFNPIQSFQYQYIGYYLKNVGHLIIEKSDGTITRNPLY